MRRTAIVAMAAGRAMRKFTLNLSFSAQPCVFVAAIVVSEIMERLSPNIAPPTQAAMMRGAEMPLFSPMPAAIGMMAATVPMDVPVAVPMKAEMRKIPAVRYCAGTMLMPRFTVASRPPMAAATAEKAPARM